MTDRRGRGRGRGRGLALPRTALVVAVLGLAACGTAPAPASSPATTSPGSHPGTPADGDGGIVDGIVGAAVRAAIPGLYLPDAVDVTTLPSGAFVVHAGGTCAELREVLLAGDWSVVDELTLPQSEGADLSSLLSLAGLAPMLVLGQGDATAAALLSGGADGCDATISMAASGPVEMTGSGFAVAGAGWSATTRCFSTSDSLSVSLVAGGSGGSALLSFDLPGTGTQRQVTSGDGADSFVVTGATGVLSTMSGFYAAAIASNGDGGDDALPPGLDMSTLHPLSADGDVLGTATLDPGADAPDGVPSGTVDLTGFTTEDGAAAHVVVPFRCVDVIRVGA